MLEYLPQLLLAWSIQLIGVISPGPGVMLIVGVATSQGRLPSLITAFGIACASIILATATVLGIAALFAGAAKAMMVLRFIGATYLFWLAYKAFRNALTQSSFEPWQSSGVAAWRGALNGFVLQLSNPKAILVWLAIASAGGVGAAPTPVIVLFVAGAFATSFIGHGGYALLLSLSPVRRLFGRFRRWIESALGCFFLFAGYKLATAKG